MKKVHLADTLFIAHLVAGILRDAGIECIVQGEYMDGAKGEVPVDMSTMPAVCVLHDKDADRAVALLEERKAAIAEAADPETDSPTDS